VTDQSTPSDMKTLNQHVMQEFRANEGKVGGPFEHIPLLLLTTIGARSSRPHTTPVGYLPDNNRLIIFATNGGQSSHPSWYHNLVAHPHVSIEVRTETLDRTAVVLTGTERDDLWAKQVRRAPIFAEYADRTTRTIPVIALEPTEPAASA
jgi:deazaflavin-dependent oxidoreductase (nitroreductase family)